MTKTELINAVAEKAEFSKKDAEKAVAAVLEGITDALISWWASAPLKCGTALPEKAKTPLPARLSRLRRRKSPLSKPAKL